MPRLKNIDEVEFCPYCQSNLGFYQRVFVKGWINDNTLFEKDKWTGKREKYNSGMYDSLDWSRAKPTCYCIECHKAIGTKKNEA